MAIELRQVRTNGVGKPTYDGIVVENTPGAIREEFSGVLKSVFGTEGQQMRLRLRDLRSLLEKSWASGGSRRAMESFGELWKGEEGKS